MAGPSDDDPESLIEAQPDSEGCCVNFFGFIRYIYHRSEVWDVMVNTALYRTYNGKSHWETTTNRQDSKLEHQAHCTVHGILGNVLR